YDAVAAGGDVVIVDTAGRLHTQSNLMDELAKVRRVIAGRRAGAPHEVLLVVDATTGQNGLQQARLFNDAVGVTGVALTKLDGSAKGGIAAAIAYELGLTVNLLGVRGDRGWIGGLGVVPAARRRGLGRALMEAVLAEAPPEVTLEVIEQNEAAIRLYEDLGFERVRLLEVWSLDAEVQASDVRVAEPSPAGERDLPWQRADASLRPGYERLEVDGGAAVVRGSGGTISLLQLRA